MPRRRLRNRRDLHRLDVEPGDAALSLSNPETWYLVVGTLPDDRVEVVPREQLDRRANNWTDFGDVLDAVNNGRLVTYSMGQDEIGPLPKPLAERDDD